MSDAATTEVREVSRLQGHGSRAASLVVAIAAVLLAAAMWGLAVALPVWETRSDTGAAIGSWTSPTSRAAAPNAIKY